MGEVCKTRKIYIFRRKQSDLHQSNQNKQRRASKMVSCIKGVKSLEASQSLCFYPTCIVVCFANFTLLAYLSLLVCPWAVRTLLLCCLSQEITSYFGQARATNSKCKLNCNNIPSRKLTLRGHFVRVSLGGGMLLQLGFNI